MENDIFNDKRNEGENVIAYRIRREANKIARNKMAKARIYWPSQLAGPLTEETATNLAEKILKTEGKITKPGEEGYEELKETKDELPNTAEAVIMDKPKRKRKSPVETYGPDGKKNAKKSRQPSRSNS